MRPMTDDTLDAQIELMAEAIYNALMSGLSNPDPWPDGYADLYRDAARAVLTTLPEANRDELISLAYDHGLSEWLFPAFMDALEARYHLVPKVQTDE